MLLKLRSTPTAISFRAGVSGDTMKMFGGFLFVILCVTLMFSGCTAEIDSARLFVVSDRYASIVFIDRQKGYILVAVMPNENLASYRGTLMREDISTDVFEALSRLSNVKPDILVTASPDQWKRLYSLSGEEEGRGDPSEPLSVAQRLNVLKSADQQSLLAIVDEFFIEGDKAEEVRDLLRFMRESRYVLRVYQMETFFTGRGHSTLLERNIKEWLKRARQEIELRSTDR